MYASPSVTNLSIVWTMAGFKSTVVPLQNRTIARKKAIGSPATMAAKGVARQAMKTNGRPFRVEVPVRAYLPKRGAAAEVGGVSHTPEGLAHNRKYARVEELHGPAV